MDRENKMESLACVTDFKQVAESKLPKEVVTYFNSGSYYQETYNDNVQAYRRYKLRPKYLRDVSRIRTDTTILGQKVSSPIGVSPMGLCRLTHPDGEVAIAKACARQGLCFGFSQFANSSWEEIANGAPECFRWAQVCLMKNPNHLAEQIHRAERAGFTAVLLTVDAPVMGKRFSELRKPVVLPSGLRWDPYSNFKGIRDESQPWTVIRNEFLTSEATWDDVKWLKTITKLPIVIKGILTGEGACEALAAGANAIMVSNVGGRQLDCVPATIDALAEVLKAVDGKCEVYLDGGVRCGLDVLKALCIGARAVFVGRPALWGLAVQGAEGAEKVLSILKEELSSGMGLLGASKMSDLSGDMVVHQSYYSSHL